MSTLKKTFIYTILLYVVYIAQIAAGRIAEGAYAEVLALPALLMLAATMVPYAHAIFLALLFGVGYEALAVAPFGLSLAGMLAGVVIATDIIYHMKERAVGSRLISALGGVITYASIVYGGAYYVVRNTVIVRIGIEETGVQIMTLIGICIVWWLIQYIRTGRSYGYST